MDPIIAAGIAVGVFLVLSLGLWARYSPENMAIAALGIALLFAALSWAEVPAGLRVLVGALGGGLITRAADQQTAIKAHQRNQRETSGDPATVPPTVPN